MVRRVQVTFCEPSRSHSLASLGRVVVRGLVEEMGHVDEEEEEEGTELGTKLCGETGVEEGTTGDGRRGGEGGAVDVTVHHGFGVASEEGGEEDESDKEPAAIGSDAKERVGTEAGIEENGQGTGRVGQGQGHQSIRGEVKGEQGAEGFEKKTQVHGPLVHVGPVVVGQCGVR